ncbi:MAG: phosphotransferase [Rhodobacteraceae bacterium]|nr:phosphotransferase [Paracoccaceae bacterium]
MATAAGLLIGETVRSVSTIHGGSLSEVVRLHLQSGQRVIAKNGPDPLAEGTMLAAIAATGARAPHVLAADETVLVLENVPEDGSLGAETWRTLAGELKRLHTGRGDRFGWDISYAFGALSINNSWQDDWHRFWAENRLLSERVVLPADLVGRLENLSDRLGDFIPQTPTPHLLHGDLWTGNVLAGQDGSVALIDPACYFGDPEVDLAMLCLFGSPPPEFWEAYGQRDAGWPERRAVYQLWPAIVHLRLFGSSYAGLCDRLLKTLRG